MYDPTWIYNPTDMERFWSYIQRQPNGCWDFVGGGNGNGYGRFNYRQKNGKHRAGYAHRFSYMVLVEPIPDGLVLDHLCRNRACVNPSHLEVVTIRENNLRGESPAAIGARRTTCDKGHPLPTLESGESRICKTCRNAYRRERWAQGLPR